MHRTQILIRSAADTDDLSIVTPADILRGASEYLVRHGWHQGVYYGSVSTPFPTADVVGAIAMAAYGRRIDDLYRPDAPAEETRLFRRAVDMFCDYLGRTEPMCRPTGDEDIDLDLDLSPYVWNDDPQRCALHVQLALVAAAKDFERTHGGAR